MAKNIKGLKKAEANGKTAEKWSKKRKLAAAVIIAVNVWFLYIVNPSF